MSKPKIENIIRRLALTASALHLSIQKSRGFVTAANTYDAAVATHEQSVTRTNDVAITARHLLWQKGAGDGTVALSAGVNMPLGTIDNVETATGLRQSVLLLGKGSTKKMVASAAIAAGVRVFAATNGKVAASGTVCVGVSLTASGADNDIIEVNDTIDTLA
ncbi:MAG TPA: hypothetical protein VIS96_07145 [Terrimicrobiaceae bacterium]